MTAPSRITADVKPPMPVPAPSPRATRLFVAGGQQRTLRGLTADMDSWYEYQKGVILDVDTVHGRAHVVHEYVSPADAAPPSQPAILFKSGTLVGDLLYVCTQTEVMIYRVPSFERVTYISLPFFNDVHHVRPTPNGTLLVADTGLDMVVELTRDGDVVNMWNVEGEPSPWTRFSPDTDYRLVPTTKPHLSHPNHVFYIGDEPWATRFQHKDAVSVTDPTRRIDIGLERLHDGVVQGDRVYFTTVDGKVAIADTHTLKVVQVMDLTKAHPDDMLLGWARGLMLDGDFMWVGFSRIRPTKIRENVGWLVRGLKRDFGTHVGCYDLRTGESVQQIAVEQYGLSAIFGIYRAPDPTAP
jgi:hypothetical protein